MGRANVLSREGEIFHLTHRRHNRAFLLRFARDRHTYRAMLREHLGLPVAIRLLRRAEHGEMRCGPSPAGVGMAGVSCGRNFVQLPSPAPNGEREFMVVRFLAGRILALPYNYETHQWVRDPRKMLDVPFARPTSN
jgi:hypothetical protein